MDINDTVMDICNSVMGVHDYICVIVDIHN